ncbi:MAG TPA: 2-amino-4-hydroxy-6-hydroxymethyldihydropteridine diphosphokinase [Rhodocyclaceae bacterium]|nr:2-amino-4-hydroxy-6-hydroxymethyldihydropteridine diphosphokinase [Rhodocyclaceae bacterium]
MTHDVFIGLGSNLAEPARQLRRAVAQIAGLDGVRVTGLSSLYASAPVGYADQPTFLNAVLRLDTHLAPRQLLGCLHLIEQDQGRTREFRDAPRTLDLDILLYDQLCQDDPIATLPHPRCHERAFVLLPLLELAPDCVIPRRGPARDWLAACAGQGITRLGPFPADDAGLHGGA